MTKEKTAKKSGRLKKLRNDVVFIDINTGKRVCSFNECVDKFDRIQEEIVKRERKFGDVVEFVARYHVCRECDRKYVNRNDKWKNHGAYVDILVGGTPKFTIKQSGENNEQREPK